MLLLLFVKLLSNQITTRSVPPGIIHTITIDRIDGTANKAPIALGLSNAHQSSLSWLIMIAGIFVDTRGFKEKIDRWVVPW
jgi:hypothetical protein